MVGRRLDTHFGAVRIVAGVHVNDAGTGAVGSALFVFGGGRFLFAILLDRTDFHLGLGKQTEKLGELRFHAGDIPAIGV